MQYANLEVRFTDLCRCMCIAIADAAYTYMTLRKHYVNNNRRALYRATERFDADCCRQPMGDESSYLSVRWTRFDTSRLTKAMRRDYKQETR